MKVLRVWLDGQSSTQKGTPIQAFPSLEPNVIGTYDDTVEYFCGIFGASIQ